MAQIRVVDYDPDWPDIFQKICHMIRPAVFPYAQSIEHIGSTSVPGLAAKPVIDLTVVVTASPDMARVIDGLKELGFFHQGDLGISGREAFTRHPDLYPHNLYACIQGNLGLKNHLTIRNYLREHPDVAAEYAILKKKLAAQYVNDIDGYVEGKSVFLCGILRKAGFSQAELDAIFTMNKKP